MIFTSYFAKIKYIKEMNDSSKIFINIARFSPKIENEDIIHMKELAPSEGLLIAYKQNLIGEKEYEKVYKEEVLKTLELNEYGEKLLSALNILSKNKDIYLMCYEKSGKFCHRHILADILNEKYKLNIQEWYYNE